jgi:iron complex transport system ATP-binding protein
MPAAPLIEFHNVTIRRGERTVLDAVSLAIAADEHVAILGPNGGGKSTLIKAITRELYPILKPEPSYVRILGRERWHLFELRGLVGIVSNDWAEACRRADPVHEMVLSGFFGSVGIWPHHVVTETMARRKGVPRRRQAGRAHGGVAERAVRHTGGSGAACGLFPHVVVVVSLDARVYVL